MRASVFDIPTRDKPATISQYDIALLKAMAPYPFIDLASVAMLTGRHYDRIKRRVNTLKAEPNQYVQICDYHMENRPIIGLRAHALTKTARTMLNAEGIPTHTNEFSGQFAHKLFSVQCRVSFDIAAREIETASVISMAELKTRERFPEATKKAESPHRITIPSLDEQGMPKNTTQDVYPDCYPFIWQNTAFEKPAFPLICEFDMSTEAHAVLRSKIRNYLYMLRSGKLKELYGFAKPYIAIVTIGEGRVAETLEDIRIETHGDLERFRDNIIVTAAPTTVFKKTIVPSGWIARAEWKRYSRPSLYLAV